MDILHFIKLKRYPGNPSLERVFIVFSKVIAFLQPNLKESFRLRKISP